MTSLTQSAIRPLVIDYQLNNVKTQILDLTSILAELDDSDIDHKAVKRLNTILRRLNADRSRLETELKRAKAKVNKLGLRSVQNG